MLPPELDTAPGGPPTIVERLPTVEASLVNARRFRLAITHSYRTFIRSGMSTKPGQGHRVETAPSVPRQHSKPLFPLGSRPRRTNADLSVRDLPSFACGVSPLVSPSLSAVRCVENN